MSACAAYATAASYATSLTAFVDCRVAAFAEEGYFALAAEGSPVRLALTGLIAILFALLGYRLVLGERFEIRDAVLTFVRLGVVLALATQWPAYQAVVYDLVVKGPAELSATMAGNNGDQAADLPARIESGFQVMEALAHPQPSAPAPVETAPDRQAVPQPTPPPSLGGALTIEEQKTLGKGSVVLLVSTLAALLSVRIVAGILLALGPLFALCLLFDGLRGWFEGWVKGLAGAALGSVAATAIVGIELAVIQPQVTELAAAARDGTLQPGQASEVLASCWLFAVVAAAAMLLVWRTAAGFRLPDWSRMTVTVAAPPAEAANRQAEVLSHKAEARTSTSSRAQQIVDAIRLADQQSGDRSSAVPAAFRLAVAGATPNEAGRAVPLGRSYRRTQTIAPAIAARRNMNR